MIESLNEELGIVKVENTALRKEIEKMESKLNALQASTQNLAEENQGLGNEIKMVSEIRDALKCTLEREKVRADQIRKDNEAMKDTVRGT